MKICHVIFSTNRIQYLTKSLESHKNLNYGNHEVTRILIDDYPKSRNYNIFKILKKIHRLDQIWMHEENKGLSATWTEFFDWIREKDFDYILHQEDDVVLLQPVHIDDLIELLNTDNDICSVILQRQPWYEREEHPCIKPEDSYFKNRYWVEKRDYSDSRNITFPIIFSLYPSWVTKDNLVQEYGFNYNEGIMMTHLRERYNKYNVFLKGNSGQNLIEHIGIETKGKRVLKGEPNYEWFEFMDPEKTYNSLTCELVE
jgi:GT2 family glycosyltransferase